MSLVLCTGTNAALTESRKLILEQDSHTVITASDKAAVAEACERSPFEIAVIGQAASPQEKRRIAATIREYSPRTKILELYAIHEGRLLPEADSWLEVPTKAPNDLAMRVSELSGSTGNIPKIDDSDSPDKK